MRIYLVLILLTVSGLVAAPPAQAQCAGFSDVPLTQPFCGHVTWLKNRQVTLGCSSTSTFCPTDPVIRLSMAAFMNRVGDVVAPRVFAIEDSGGPLDLLNPNTVCITNIPPRPYGRSVLLDAVLSYDVSTLTSLNLAVGKSVNGGPLLLLGATQPIASPNRRNHHPVTAAGGTTGLTIGPNEAHQYFVFVRTSPPHAATLSAWTCHLQVLLHQRVEL